MDPRLRGRRCSQGSMENVAHILHHCMCNSRAYTHRHNAVLQRMIKAVTHNWKIYCADYLIPGTGLKPDLILVKGDTALIPDVKIIHENKKASFVKARKDKKSKYQSLVAHLGNKF